jgi:CubicO group peptidase (beta-lactamase class C family)
MMTKPSKLATGLFLTLLVFPIAIYASPSDQADEIERFMTALHDRGQFNGSIIVAVGGKAIYRNAFGEADFQSHRKFTPQTISYLASVAKQFTAMTIMMLAERHQLNFDDQVAKFIPQLAASLNGITLRHLLNQTSGIPDVGDLGIDHPRLSNQEVLHRLSQPGFLVSRPGEKYRYSNANYVLLAVVVEKVSGQRFADFLAANILKPLGMHDTFVYDGSPRDMDVIAMAYDQFGTPAPDDTLMTGSGGVYSTVDDLLKWDQALDAQRLVSRATLDQAFTPGRVKEGVSTYGFGWNISDQDGRKFVWHQGAAGGYRALIERGLTDKITVIILTNKGNSKRLQINDAIVNILNDRPYVFPKRSIAELMYGTITKQGIGPAIQNYNSLRAANDATYDFAESELNALGYQLLYGDHNPGDAIQIFKLNTDAYPNSSNAFDSLAEACQVNGEKALAIKNYQKAVALDPTDLHAVDMLKKLQ